MLSVPTDAEGIEIRGIQTLGGKEVNDVFLTDCYVPDDRVLGEEGDGWMQLMAGLNVERLILAATALGIAQRAFDDVLDYVKERKQFGRPIGSLPGAQAPDRRPRDRARVRAAAGLRRRPQGRRGPGPDAPPRGLDGEAEGDRGRQAACSLEGMQMMGGYGYASEYDMERHVRASLVMSIYGGTNEIQREIVSKTYGL